MIPLLPKNEQARVHRFVKKARHDQKCYQCDSRRCLSVEHLIADFAGWGVPFTILDEDGWMNELNGLDFSFTAQEKT